MVDAIYFYHQKKRGLKLDKVMEGGRNDPMVKGGP